MCGKETESEQAALSSILSAVFQIHERNCTFLKKGLQNADKCDNIFPVKTNVFLKQTDSKGVTMEEQTKYFVLKQKAVPEVLLKVVEAKKLIDSERAITIQEATEKVGISRSSFYKYKDDIFPFYDNAKGKTITMVLQMDDEQGLLSDLLHIVAVYKANILTIHQSIPVNNVATLTLSVEVRPDTGNISRMVEEMEENKGVHNVKIIARE